MHDAAAVGVVDLAHLGVAGADGVDQRDLRDTLSRVDDEAGLLVQDQRLFVLVEDAERHVRRGEIHVAQRRLLDGDGDAGGDGRARLQDGGAVHLHLAGLDQAAHLRARQRRHLCGHSEVQTSVLGDDEAGDRAHPACSALVSPPVRAGDAGASSGSMKERIAMPITPMTMAESARLKAG